MINVKEFRKKYCKPTLTERLETITQMLYEYRGILNSGQDLRILSDPYIQTGSVYIRPDNTVLLSPEDAYGLD